MDDLFEFPDDMDIDHMYRDDDEDYEPQKIFGCACEEPLAVDRACRSCRETMGQIILTDGGGYRKMRRRRGYSRFPSRRVRFRERWVVIQTNAGQYRPVYDDPEYIPF